MLHQLKRLIKLCVKVKLCIGLFNLIASFCLFARFVLSLFELFASSSTVVYKCMVGLSVLGLKTALLNLLNLLFLTIIVKCI